MSGHNKWSKIKHKKAKTDAAKSGAFTKVIREIMSAVKLGGPDPEGNFRLRLAIDKAKAVNMPNANIESAIKKGQAKDAASLEEIVYEGYAPGGIALFVEAMTDNRNRTVSHVRSTIEKNGGNLGTPGSVSWMFEKKGVFELASGSTTEDRLMEVVLEAGAEDIVKNEDDSFTVTCPPDQYESVQKALESAGLSFDSGELIQVPKEEVDVSDLEILKKIVALMDRLDESEDVQKVYANFKASDDLMAQAYS